MPGTGDCTKTNAIYQCTVTSGDTVQTYDGATTYIAIRYYNHRSDANNERGTPHPREFRFRGVMKHEVLGVFWVHMAHD